MDISIDNVTSKVKHLYQTLGLTVVRRAIGYGLESYEFTETLDDCDLRLVLLIKAQLEVKSIFMIGNAWGWGALCLATIFPFARIVVMDAECEGADVAFGSEITHKIIDKYGLNIHLSRMKSPEQVHIAAENRKFDLAIINGRHGEMQIVEDFLAISPFLKPVCMVMLPMLGKNSLSRGFSVIEMGARQLGFKFFDYASAATVGGTSLVGRGININSCRAKATTFKIL